YWGSSESEIDPKTGNPGATYNRYWACLYEFRKAMGMKIIDQNYNPSIVGYVDAKYYCPKALKGTTESQVKDSNGSFMPLWVRPMHYSYGMNVQGVDVNIPGSSDYAWDASKAPQADPNLNLKTQGAFHGFRANSVRRPAEKLM